MGFSEIISLVTEGKKGVHQKMAYKDTGGSMKAEIYGDVSVLLISNDWTHGDRKCMQ